MIRKQVYLTEEQNLILKYNAKLKNGVSESMQIRIALDYFFKIKYTCDKDGVKIDNTPNFLNNLKEELKNDRRNIV